MPKIPRNKSKFIASDRNVLRPTGGIASAVQPGPINLTCPHCQRIGTFGAYAGWADVTYFRNGIMTYQSGSKNELSMATTIGLRCCPNQICHGLVTVAWDSEGILLVSPPELITFDVQNIPKRIVDSITEALASHSVKAYRASALMVRRTLELLCEEKAASGKNLHDRIKNLAQHAILPPALLAGADSLRLLGNDAAHVEAKDYDDIDEEHSAIAIELTREILKAVYQHDSLVARLSRLQRPNNSPE